MAKRTLYKREAKPESFAEIFSKKETEFKEKSKKTSREYLPELYEIERIISTRGRRQVWQLIFCPLLICELLSADIRVLFPNSNRSLRESLLQMFLNIIGRIISFTSVVKISLINMNTSIIEI